MSSVRGELHAWIDANAEKIDCINFGEIILQVADRKLQAATIIDKHKRGKEFTSQSLLTSNSK